MSVPDDVFADDQWLGSPEVCDGIKNVRTEGGNIYIDYDRSIPTTNVTFLSFHFALKTSWIGQPITFDVGSGVVHIETAYVISIKFAMPVVDRYMCVLQCTTAGDRASGHELAQLLRKEYKVSINVSEFEPSDYSQFKCHNTEVLARRWCEFRNIPYFDGNFFFLSKARFQFPEPFIVPGPRSPPFDKDMDRFSGEPHVVQYSLSTLPRNLTVVREFSYVYGVFHNYYQLWHTIFDFMIPLYNFMFNVWKRPENTSQKIVYVRSDGVWGFDVMMLIFSDYPVTVIHNLDDALLLREGVIGIEKPEKDVNPDRTIDDSIGFQYEFNRSMALGMRETVLERLGIPVDRVGRNGRPLVTVVNRGSGLRNMGNTKEVVAVIKAGCPHCDIAKVDFQLMPVESQIELVSKSSVLVGFHGSGLTHALWMAESRVGHRTHLVEILPYKYTCRNWYHTAADVAGVKYHSIINRKRPVGASNAAKVCWSGVCSSVACHDVLRDQKTFVELDVFNETWIKIAKELEETIVVE